MSDNTICTSECVKCINGILNKINKAKVEIYCKEKDKTFFYGQRICCDDYKKKE